MNTIVTKTKGSVDNSDFLELNEVRFRVLKENNGNANAIVLSSSVDMPVYIIGDGYFTSEDLTQNLGKSVSIAKSTIGTCLRIVANEDCYLSVRNFSNITSISFRNTYLNTPSKLKLKFDDIIGYECGLTNYGSVYPIGIIDINDFAFYVNKMSSGDKMIILNDIEGDVSAIKDIKHSLKQFGSNLTTSATKGLEGNVKDFAKLAMKYCNFLQLTNNSELYGSIEELAEEMLLIGGRLAVNNLTVGLVGTQCTYNGVVVTKSYQIRFENGTYTVI